MTNEIFIIKLYKREDELFKICSYHNLDYSSSKDIIQETYIKLLKFKDIDRYTIDGEPNMYIVFMVIRNTISDFRKKEKKYDSDDICEYDIISIDEEENEKYDFILNEIEKIQYWFDKNIIDLYIKKHHTIRSLSKETKIPFSTIQPIVFKFKNQCKENYKKRIL